MRHVPDAVRCTGSWPSLWMPQTSQQNPWTVSGVSRTSEMVPVSSISSVVTEKSVNSKWSLVALTTGKAVEFRVDKTIARRAASLVEDLVATQSPPAITAAPPSGTGSLAEDLMKLNREFEDGLLT